MTKDLCRARLIIEALTPISHFDTRTGIDNGTNLRLAMTQATIVGGRMVYVPHITENSLRTVLVRAPLADHLMAVLGIKGGLPRSVLNLLYAGGQMGGGRTPGDDTDIGHKLMAAYPSIGLVGGATDGSILPRSRLKLCSWIVGRENALALRGLFPADVAERAEAISAFDLIGEETRTRGTSSEASGNQMLYGYEVFAAGTQIALEMTFDPFASSTVLGAAGRALAEWSGFLGGQGRQGRGHCGVVRWAAVARRLRCSPRRACRHDAGRAARRDVWRRPAPVVRGLSRAHG